MFHALPYTPRINFFLKRTRFGGGSEKRGRHSPPNRLCSTPSFIHHGIIIFWKGYDLTTWEKHKFWKWHDLGEGQKSEDVTLPPNILCSTSSFIHQGIIIFWKGHDLTTWEKHKFWKWHDLGEDQKSEGVTLPPNRLCSTPSSIHEGKHVFWKVTRYFRKSHWDLVSLLTIDHPYTIFVKITNPQDHVLFRNYAFLDV